LNVNKLLLNRVLNVGISLVWLVNGLYCKLLNLVPRHQQIVARILGEDYAVIITKTIGILEILMVVWILSRIQSRWCAIMQIIVVAAMNIIEFVLVSDLLLFGRINILVATLFIAIIAVNQFIADRAALARQ